MKATALLNRGGGAVARDPDIADKARRALDQAGIEAEVELIDAGETETRSNAAAERGDRLLIVGGGDGTIGAAASALAGTGTTLGILPLGTLNHFARDLGIPAGLDEAAQLIASGPERRVDVAEMNGRMFINNSALGLYPLMVVDRDVQQKRLGRSKRLAVVVASLRTLIRFNHQRLTLTVNDEEQARVDTPLLFVGNNDYRIDIGAPGSRASLDDGQLCVLVMRKKTRAGFVAASIRALFNRTKPDDMVRIEGVERLRVASRRSQLTVGLDGEVISVSPPLDYRIRKRTLRVIAPLTGRAHKKAAEGFPPAA
ncbi:MAG TPA: diacylglycerol kinase family protein [Sphingomicrobium sp.]|nr:diacylglycerol kinase family protein [Sphingomicrobium sp.]